MPDRDYGRLGRIGVVTPQSNPTVEPELSILMPEHVSLLTTRCTSRAEPKQRFLEYFQKLDETIQTFDGLHLDALAFACTASSYLVNRAEEREQCQRLRRRYGYPVVTAAMAIEQALRYLGARRIALACPYPAWLLAEAEAYWSQQGFEIAVAMSAQPGMRDTRSIYNLRGPEVTSRILAAIRDVDADAVVITGTGMPGLQLVCELQEATGRPAMNSNLCLAWACLRAAGIDPGSRGPQTDFPLLGGWRKDLARL